VIIAHYEKVNSLTTLLKTLCAGQKPVTLNTQLRQIILRYSGGHKTASHMLNHGHLKKNC